MKPAQKPSNPCFGSGPCAKRPGWAFANFDPEILGRSHRSATGKKMLQNVITHTRSILGIPDGCLIGITPASDTGAVEMALWNLLGADGIGVDVFAWERFSRLWLEDITQELKIKDCRTFEADYGLLPDMARMEPDRDAVFVWNGTTSGVCLQSTHIQKGNKGLRICDATSGVFAYDLPWNILDVVTWSWQKVMGGEAQHGIIVLSPKAVARLENYKPSWPIPKILKLHDDKGAVNKEFFEGSTINTPSMLCVADALDSLQWMKSIGGLPQIMKRVDDNAKALDAWVQKTPWIDYLVADKTIRSKTSVCLKITDSADRIDNMCKTLSQEKVAYDIKSYKTAPAGLRIWCGATVETRDIQALTAWIDWAYRHASNGSN